MPKLKTESYGSGDQSWLGSTHGIGNARTVTLDPAKFTKATHFPDGYFKSGQPLAIVGDSAVPYDSDGADGSQNLAGFLLFDVSTDGTAKAPAALLDHGRIRVDRLPVEGFTAPAPDADKTTCVYA